MHQEVGAVDPWRAAARKPAAAVCIVEKYRLSAGASHQVERHSLRHMPGVHAIQVVKEWSILLESVVERAMITGHEFCAVAEVILKRAQQAGTDVGAFVLRRSQKRLGRVLVLRGEK